MSYAMAGKIVGYRRNAFAGLGDAAYDAALQAYNVDHAQWAIDKQNFDQATAAWQAQLNQQNAVYNAAFQAYMADSAKWRTEQATYTAQLNAYQHPPMQAAPTYGFQQQAALTQYPSIVIPAGYAGCVTQAQHDAWAATCAQQQSVKGLGAVPTGPACGLALLPVCVPPPPARVPPAPLRAQPQAPMQPSPPMGPAPLRPEPQPPAPPAAVPPPPVAQQPVPPPSVITPSYTADSLVPVPASTTPAPSTTPKPAGAGLISNGLIILVLAGGSYALYRTFKKPKKKAA